MEIRKLLPYLFALLLVSGLSSCDKDDDKDKEPSKRDLLTAHTWSGQAIYIYGEDWSDLFLEELGFDIKENRIKYERDGTYAETSGPMTFRGNWEFTNNEQAILFDKGTEDEYTSRILRLTATELYIEHIIELEDFDPIPLEFRFKK